jgi:hypothetical protein
VLRVFTLVIALCGCRDADLQHVKAVRDEVCLCKTVGCGEDAMKKLPSHNVKATRRQQTLANEMLTCMSKLYLKDRPTTDPDATSHGSSDPASARTP